MFTQFVMMRVTWCDDVYQSIMKHSNVVFFTFFVFTDLSKVNVIGTDAETSRVNVNWERLVCGYEDEDLHVTSYTIICTSQSGALTFMIELY